MTSKLEKPIGNAAKHQRNQSVPISFRGPIYKPDEGMKLLNSYTLYNP